MKAIKNPTKPSASSIEFYSKELGVMKCAERDNADGTVAVCDV
jgi:hypothetical protein